MRRVTLDLLEQEMTRMRSLLGQAELARPVPSCPGWDVEALGEHLGRVHHWAERAVSTGAFPGPDYPRAERGGRPLADWYAARATSLLDVLAAAGPDAPAWTFQPGEQHAGFWRRRQLHETTVHRVDAEQALGRSMLGQADDRVDGLTDAVAADGVAEVLQVFMPRWLWRRRDEPPTDVYPLQRPVAFVCTDVDRAWTVVLERAADGPGLLVREGRHHPAATISGPATVLYLAAWGRAPRRLLTLGGDVDLAADLLDRALTP